MSQDISIHSVVQQRYGAIADGTAASCCGTGSDCCGSDTPVQLYEDALTAGLPVEVTALSLG